MREIAMFVEDDAHRQVIGPLSNESRTNTRREYDSVGETPYVAMARSCRKLRIYLHDLKKQGGPWPLMVIVATDANCDGLNYRTTEISKHTRRARAPVVLAIPDPHVERWLLLDGSAFKAAVGQGCDAPDQKCDRHRYKQRLKIEAVRDAGVRTLP